MTCSPSSRAARSRSWSTRPTSCATRPKRTAISKAARRPGRPCSRYELSLNCDGRLEPAIKTRGSSPQVMIWREAATLGIHRAEELGIVLRILELVDQELKSVDGAHRHQHAAQHPHLREDTAIDQQLLLAGA